jgi:hypothetical protein
MKGPARRFVWLEKQIALDRELTGNDLRVAIYVFKRYREEKACAAFSTRSAAADLRISRGAAMRSLQHLEEREHITRLNVAHAGRNQQARFALGDGLRGESRGGLRAESI